VEKPEELGILVDEKYGAEIIKEANQKEIITSVGVEKSGVDVFDFEYGRKFGKHIEKLNPSYVKVLVRYNPENAKENVKQLKRLEKLSKYCEKKGRKLLFELLVPSTDADLAAGKDYDTEIRPEKTAIAIREIREKVAVSLWKLEGFSTEGWRKVLEVIPEDKKVIVLGRGEDAERVRYWLTVAAEFDQIIGFAIGRTIFMEPLISHLKNSLGKEETIKAIAVNYRNFVEIWREGRA